MNKVNILIDFEALSMPFCRNANVRVDFPYACSIGVLGKDNKYKYKTFLFNPKQQASSINEILRKWIITNTRDILNNRKFVINEKTTFFTAYDNNLEQKILKDIFPGVTVFDQSEGCQISLDRISHRHTGEVKYFDKIREEAKLLTGEFYKRRGLENDGALAAYAGYLIITSNWKGDIKWKSKLKMSVIKREVEKYSKDDVVRMGYLDKNKKLMNEDIVQLKIQNKEIMKLRKINTFNKKVLEYLSTLKKGTTIGDVKQNLSKDSDKNLSTITKLKKIKNIKK